MPRNLTPRSLAALAVVAVSFFLVVCVARYGAAEFENPRAAETAGFAASMSGWLVQTLGAGLWALLVLPLAWGAIVYFDEETPDVLLRLAGTIVLAVSISTIVGLAGGGLWAGHVGAGVASALGGLSDRIGALGTILAWCLALALLGVSGIFATDWMFHSLRRAGRTAAAAASHVAVAEPVAELLEDPADAEPRTFVPSPRAEAAAVESVATSSELVAPEGWDSHESSGRTVLAAPSGYRGVEFLPPSDELAVPAREPVPADEPVVESESLFEQEFVATPEAAFFVERPDLAETQDIFEEPAEEPPAAEADVSDEVEEAVETLFAAVTEPEPAAESAPAPAASVASASGIGLPADSPFLDEFFPAEAGWPYAEEPVPSDGASAASEMAEAYAAPAPAPEPAPAAPLPVQRVAEPAFEDEPVAFEDVILSRLAAPEFEDVLPIAPVPEPLSVSAPAPEAVLSSSSSEFAPALAPAEEAAVAVAEPVGLAVEAPPQVAEPEAPPVAETVPASAAVAATEPAPQLDLFAASEIVSEPASGELAPAPAPAAAPRVAPDLTRLAALELDPLFYEAMDAVLDRGRASAVVLQRQLGIGYARGIRILDQMTSAGLIGPDTPSGSREIRVAAEAWRSYRGA